MWLCVYYTFVFVQCILDEWLSFVDRSKEMVTPSFFHLIRFNGFISILFRCLLCNHRRRYIGVGHLFASSSSSFSDCPFWLLYITSVAATSAENLPCLRLNKREHSFLSLIDDVRCFLLSIQTAFRSESKTNSSTFNIGGGGRKTSASQRNCWWLSGSE